MPQDGALLHVDAVQAAGRMPVSLAASARTALPCRRTSSAARRAPGRCCWRPKVSAIAPLIAGGGQERGRRGGTPPLPAIAGFAAAAAVAYDAAHLAPLRDAIEQAAMAQGAIICGAGAPRLANTTCLALPGVRADAQVIALDLDGFAVSAGAACSSGKVATSHVLAAMGLGSLAGQAIRVSLPWNATAEHVRRVCRCLSAHGGPAAQCAGVPRRLNPHCPHDHPTAPTTQPPGLPRQSGDHPVRPARHGGDAALVHRAIRQSAQRRACDGPRGGGRGGGCARPTSPH